MQTTLITKDNSAVVINERNGWVWANLYVNARGGIANADITLIKWSGKTMKGAIAWARKQLGETVH